MAGFVPISGAVVADTAYMDGTLVARDLSITLPEVTPLTVDLPMLGTFTMPMWTLFENMQLTVTKIGVDTGISKMIKPESINIELRGVHPIVNADSTTKNAKNKIFLKGISLGVPGFGWEIGSLSENEYNYSCIRYEYQLDGEQVFLIDRAAHQVRVNGKDYFAEIESFL